MKQLKRLMMLIAIVLPTMAFPTTWTTHAQSVPPHYTMIDLGTLGGPNNYGENPGAVLNNQEALLFGADNAGLDPHQDNCFNPDCFRDDAAVWKNGHLIDLGTFPGVTSSGAAGMSTNGLVAGLATDGTIDPVSNTPVFRAALFGNGHVTDLGTLGGTFSGANDVNSQVVGLAENETADPYASGLGGAQNQTALPGAGQNRAFLWDSGGMRDLGTLGGNDAEAWMINESGQIIGASYTNTTPNDSTGLPTQHPFLWDHGTMVDLGTLGGAFGTPADLNNGGQVVGSMNLAGDQTHHAFLWNKGKLTDLGTLGGASSDALWENAAGDVVGRADVVNSGQACSVGVPLSQNNCPHHAILWKNGQMTDLGLLAGAACTTATGINSLDQVVGSAGKCGSGAGAFLWDNGTLYNTNDLVAPSPSGLRLHATFYINDRGEILGVAQPPTGPERVVLLEPDHRNTAADGSEVTSAGGSSASFTVSFDSTTAGQGRVLFGSSPGCSGLVETATRDSGTGTTSHAVAVTGNDLAGTVGDNGIVPGATYRYEVITQTRSGQEVDNNSGKCYSVTVPT